MLKLDHFFLSKIPIFRSRGSTLFSEVTCFYQRGRGSALRGKWVISSQIGRGWWCISCIRRLVLPFKGRIRGRRWRISYMRRLVLPFKERVGGRRWRIYRARRLVLPFKWTYFPNTRPRKRLSTLNSRQGMEGGTLSPGESIR